MVGGDMESLIQWEVNYKVTPLIDGFGWLSDWVSHKWRRTCDRCSLGILLLIVWLGEETILQELQAHEFSCFVLWILKRSGIVCSFIADGGWKIAQANAVAPSLFVFLADKEQAFFILES